METETKIFGKLNVISVEQTVVDKKLTEIKLDQTNSKDEFNDDNWSTHALILNQKSNRKAWLEGITAQFVELSTQRLSHSKKEYGSNLTEQDIDLNISYFVKSLGMMLGYFINSSSWADQELKDYDRAELKNRLQKLIMHL